MGTLFKHFRWSFCRMKQSRLKQNSAVEKQQFKNILINKSNNITTISINRPSSRNSLDTTTLQELSDAFSQSDKDPETKVIVLSGEGGNLSSGFDLREIKNVGYDALKDAAQWLVRRPLTNKPCVCAVSGYAVGEGLELSLACDLRVIEDTAVMGFLGRRFGVPNSLDGGARLTALAGQSRSLDLVITGRLIPGTVAHEWGLAARFVATGTAVGQAINLAMSIAKFSQAALVVDKLSAMDCRREDDGARREATALSLQGRLAEEMTEGVEKFHKGIGRHGKFSGLTERQVKFWELEKDDNLK